MNKEKVQLEIKPGVGESSQKPAQRYLGQFVSINNLRLHYVSKGTGRPVVFVHGNPGSHQDFSMGVLGRVARSYRVFAFDRPGHGYSERVHGSTSTAEAQASLLRETLRQLAIDKPLLVGHSWGGALALAAAVEFGDELSGLVLLAPAAYPSDSNEWWTILPRIPLIGDLFVRTLTPLVGRRMVQQSLREAYHPAPVQDDYLQSAETMWTRPAQVKACARDDRSLNRSLNSLSQRYGEIRLPVVIVAGDSDKLLEPRSQAQRLHQDIHGSELVMLEQTGHQIPQTRPESVVAAIELGWKLATGD